MGKKRTGIQEELARTLEEMTCEAQATLAAFGCTGVTDCPCCGGRLDHLRDCPAEMLGETIQVAFHVLEQFQKGSDGN